MLVYFAHQTRAAHVPHDGSSFWLIVAAIATLLVIALWVSRSQTNKPVDQEEE